MGLPTFVPTIDHAHAEFGTFDLGLIDNVAPTDPRLGGRAALFSQNVNYDRRTIARRKGIQRVTENPPGAAQIRTFEQPAETWVAVLGTAVIDATNFINKKMANGVASTEGLQITSAAGLAIASSSIPVQNMSGHEHDVFYVWAKLNATPPADYDISLRLSSAANDYYQMKIFESSKESMDQNYPMYLRGKRSSAVKTGNPDWTSITTVAILLVRNSGTAEMDITVDNLAWNPGRGQALVQFRRQSDTTFKGSRDTYAVNAGKLYRYDKENEGWIDMGDLFDEEAEVNYMVMDDRLYLCDGINKNQKIQPDGETIYQMGIDELTAPIGATEQNDGFPFEGEFIDGNITNGSHFFAITYYSTITGIESAPHLRNGQEIVIAGGSQVILYTGIPKTPDPQVTHVRIYRRSSISTVFRRTSSDPDGEILNGQSQFAEGLADSALGAEMDPDLDSPRPAKFMAAWPELGVAAAVFSDTPGVVNLSSPSGTAENWPVEFAIQAARNDNDSLSGLAYYRGRMVAFTPDRVMVGGFVGGLEFVRFRNLATDRGAVSHKAIVSVENNLYYPSEDGIHYFDESEVVRKVTSLQQNTWDIHVSKSRLNRSCAVQSRKRYQYQLFAAQAGLPQNSFAWNLHYDSIIVDESFTKGLGPGHTSASSLHTLSAMDCQEIEVADNKKEIWILGADGQVYRIDTGDSDDGHEFELRHRTSLISPYGAGYQHRFVWLDLDLRQYSTAQLQTDFWFDFSLATPSASLLAQLSSDDAPVLGTKFIAGTSRVGQPLGITRRLRLPANRARRIMMEFRQSGRTDMEIYNFRLYADRMGTT
jgi:hypothetical protein